MTFKDWFLEKFVEWRGKTTNGPTAYARYLDIKQQAVNDWLQGKYVPKSHEHISKLAEKYPDIYRVLGMSDPRGNLPPEFSDLFDRIKSAIEKAGVDPESPEANRFRHTFAIQYLRNGGDVFTLQRILGHSSLSTTRKYLLLIDADAKSVHQRSSPVARWRL